MSYFLVKYWWAGLIAILTLAIWVQEGRVQSTHTALKQAQIAADYEREARKVAVQKHETEIESIRQEYRQQIGEIDREHMDSLLELARIADLERDGVASLRDKLTSATRRGDRLETSAAFCERERHRLEKLGELASEGAELVVEARRLLRERDEQVKRLLDQIHLDRGAVEKAAAIQVFAR